MERPASEGSVESDGISGVAMLAVNDVLGMVATPQGSCEYHHDHRNILISNIYNNPQYKHQLTISSSLNINDNFLPNFRTVTYP